MSEKVKIEVEGTKVPVYKYEKGGIVYYEFDTSELGPPEPMINALSVLKLLKSPNEVVIMINHSKPVGLFDKIVDKYTYEVEKLVNGKYKITLKLING